MLSKYEIIKRDIINKIDEGIFKAGEKIYSENDLKEKYSVSSTTVVKALNDLVKEGILIRKQGRGTFVRRQLLHKKVLFTELTPKEKSSHKTDDKAITKILFPYGEREIATKLGSKSGREEIVQIRQITLSGETIWKIEDRYLFKDKLSPEAIERLGKGASLSKELNLSEHMSNQPLKMTVKYTSLDKNSDIFKIMKKNNKESKNIEEMSIIFLEKLVYDSEGMPITYSQSYIHPNYYEIEIVSE